MTLKELRTAIAAIPAEFDDCPVILQKDSEGNGYSPLSEIDFQCCYVAENSYSGNAFSHSWSHEDAGFYTVEEWDKIKKNNLAIILIPTN